MEYTSKIMDRVEDFFTEAYDVAVDVVVQPIKRILKIGTIVVTMIFTPEVANSEVYNSESSNLVQGIDTPIAVQLESCEVKTSATFDSVFRRMAVLKSLDETFESQFSSTDIDKEDFKVIFDEVAMTVAGWNVLDSYVDVSRLRNIVDFNLILEHGLFVSVAKTLGGATDDVMFSISHNGRTLVIDKLPLAELNEKVLGMMAELNANIDSEA